MVHQNDCESSEPRHIYSFGLQLQAYDIVPGTPYVLASMVGSSSASKMQLTKISPTTAWSNQSLVIMRFEARR